MKILHLIIDHQVIERSLDLYEEIFPNSNQVLIFDPYGYGHYKHIKKYADCPCVKFDQVEGYASSFDFSGVTTIIAHYMSLDMVKFIKESPTSIHVCWEIYGMDLYGQFLEPLGYKLCYIEKYKYEPFGYFKHFFPFFYKLAVKAKGFHYYSNEEIKSLFSYISLRVNSIQYANIYDVKYVEQCAGHTIPSYEFFNYPLDKVLGNFKDKNFVKGEDIMIGNSASFTNNHLYVLNYLKKLNISKNSKIVLPLSYSGCAKYVDMVVKKYRYQFGENTLPLRKYLPLYEYNKVFLNLKVMILATWRQESTGTAIMGLYLGIKIFMSEKSPLYKWFKNCGFIIYCLEKVTSQEFNTYMSSEEQKHNRTLLIERYDMDIAKKNLINNIK